MTELTSKVRELVAQGKTLEAIKMIKLVATEDSILNSITILESRLNRLNRDESLGLASNSEINIAYNQVTVSLLSLISELDEISEKKIDTGKSNELNVFISYSHKDEIYRESLETSLSLLKRDKLIKTWSDRIIMPGQKWKDEISSNLENADIIIFLVSPDFIASDYSYEIELQRALERHDKREAVVIPIIVRHSAWKNSPIGNFQVLPRDGKPVSTWIDIDEAWLFIYEGIRKVCLDILGNSKNEERINKKIKSLLKVKIGVFGETGTGKSTLCNAILGQEIMRVSDLVPVTRGTESATLVATDELAIEIIDYPGIGESVDGDKKYEELYENGFQNLDMIIWVLRSDVRNYRWSQYHIDKIINLNILEGKEYLLILSMVDRMDVSGIWNEENNIPSKGVLSMIERKIMYTSGVLRVPPDKIIPVSGLKGYNIENVKITIVSLMKELKKINKYN